MLRLIVLALLVLNLGVFARGQGWLLAYGWGPTQQREPQRVAQQVQPQAVTVLGAASSAPAPETPVSAPIPAPVTPPTPTAAPAELVAATCWQMADMDEKQAETLRPLLKANFSEGVWALDETRVGARWMVYMGKYNNPDDLAKKREQLVALKVKFSPLINTARSPGFSLGVFSTEEAANTALQDVVQRGVRSAKVVQERPETLHYRLRLPAVRPADQSALDVIKAALPGKTLETCPVAANTAPPVSTASSVPASAEPPVSRPAVR